MEELHNEKAKESEEYFKQYGFDLYPERRSVEKDLTFFDKIGYKKINKRNCERNVLLAIQNNPIIQLLLGALKKKGCPVNIKRHIACEKCSSKVMGGFDQEYNQIVICQNGGGNTEAALVHELIHMYDYCAGEIDFKNLEHLACTEIRAANVAHCSFLASFFSYQSSLMNIKKTHQDCVKIRAAESMMATRNLKFEEAMESIEKVFDKCYNDLEPVGRRLRRKSSDLIMAYNEAVQVGVCEPGTNFE